SGDIDRSLDPIALHHYMTFHSVVPAPHTILRGVRKLPPATVAVLTPDGALRQRRYWEPRFTSSAEQRQVSFEEWQERVLPALRLAVRRGLVAGVPVGVLLSGGLDSSLIVGLLAETEQQRIETFSIGFESVGGESGDEFQYPDLIARHFGTQHHRIRVDAARSLASLPACIAARSEEHTSELQSRENLVCRLL